MRRVQPTKRVNVRSQFAPRIPVDLALAVAPLEEATGEVGQLGDAAQALRITLGHKGLDRAENVGAERAPADRFRQHDLGLLIGLGEVEPDADVLRADQRLEVVDVVDQT